MWQLSTITRLTATHTKSRRKGHGSRVMSTDRLPRCCSFLSTRLHACGPRIGLNGLASSGPGHPAWARPDPLLYPVHKCTPPPVQVCTGEIRTPLGALLHAVEAARVAVAIEALRAHGGRASTVGLRSLTTPAARIFARAPTPIIHNSPRCAPGRGPIVAYGVEFR